MTRLADELRAVLGVREPQGTPRFEPSPAAVEEEAASRLYGEKTGTVNASPASPPLGRAAEPPGTHPAEGGEREEAATTDHRPTRR